MAYFFTRPRKRENLSKSLSFSDSAFSISFLPFSTENVHSPLSHFFYQDSHLRM